ncbi:MAG: hypothetical protein AAGC64_07240 [Bacteroidota bacterium]
MRMIKKCIPAVLWIIIMATLLWSCDENTEELTPTNSELDIRSSFVSNSNAALSQLRDLGFLGPTGAIFGNRFGSVENGRMAGSPMSLIQARTNTDTSEVDKCYTEIWEVDGQGNYRFVLDFGNGCDFYRRYMYGRMEEIGSYTDSSFSSSVTYTQFGGSRGDGGAEWWVDGTHSYTGTWSGGRKDDGIKRDSTDRDSTSHTEYDYSYSATYEFSADLIQTYIEFIGAPEDSVTTGEDIYIVDYVADGQEEMDQDGYTIVSKTESVSANTGESYSSQIDTPLFMDYSCANTWIFVSGTESGMYTYEGVTDSYSIDYGNGECDNIILLTENGETEEIDLGKEWND